MNAVVQKRLWDSFGITFYTDYPPFWEIVCLVECRKWLNIWTSIVILLRSNTIGIPEWNELATTVYIDNCHFNVINFFFQLPPILYSYFTVKYVLIFFIYLDRLYVVEFRITVMMYICIYTFNVTRPSATNNLWFGACHFAFLTKAQCRITFWLSL